MRNAAILAFVAAFFGGIVTLWAAFQERRSIAKWSFVGGMALFVLEALFSGLAAHTEAGVDAVQNWQRWRMAVDAWLPVTWLLFGLTYARGNGGEFIWRWRWTLAAGLMPIVLAGMFNHDLIQVEFFTFSPDLRLLRLTTAGQILCTFFLIGAVLILTNLERTFRSAIGTMRWRVKFMILGVGLIFAVRSYTGLEAILLRGPGIDETFLEVDSVALIIGSLLLMRSLQRGAAEVSIYPPFAVLQNSVIILLAGLYFLVVGVFAKIVQWLGDGSGFGTKVFVILLLLVGATVAGFSDRVRLRARQFFSRYLQRPLYDYRTVWRSFTDAIASRVKQDDLCEAAVKQMAEFFQALSVTIWLVDDRRENLDFAASTSLSSTKGKELAPDRIESSAILQAMQQHPDPQNFETDGGAWAEALRRCHPTQFRTGGSRICAPMFARGQMLGVITLGDRVGGIHFSLQDFDLLKCVGDQVAAGLLNAQLSQKLLQTKELEAFQTMSAFFVHDLKNTASTLNLMLKNLPVHFDNPAFREDALRGVAKTCDHINHLITRLSLLRHDLQIRPTEMDLNDVVTRVLANWNGATGVNLVKHIQPGPKIMLDQEQVFKVVTNLVLNATEAVGKNGEVRVETGQQNGWAVLTVADNGCGMDPEFMRRALFRPFQTTKKNGFGIGMFQSKMIVEAHGGRIEVQSELKKGTTFRVLLPTQRKLP